MTVAFISQGLSSCGNQQQKSDFGKPTSLPNSFVLWRISRSGLVICSFVSRKSIRRFGPLFVATPARKNLPIAIYRAN